MMNFMVQFAKLSLEKREEYFHKFIVCIEILSKTYFITVIDHIKIRMVMGNQHQSS